LNVVHDRPLDSPKPSRGEDKGAFPRGLTLKKNKHFSRVPEPSWGEMLRAAGEGEKATVLGTY